MTYRGPGQPFFVLRTGRTIRPAVTLWNEDGVTGMTRRLPRRSIDVIVTSPPYNRGVPYAHYRDRRPRADYLGWMGELAASVDTVLRPRGSFFLNVGSPPRDPWFAWEVARTIGERFTLQNVLHWVKSIALDRRFIGRAAAVDRDLAVGHYRPVASERFVHSAQEYVFHFTRTGRVPLDRLAIGVPYQDRSNVARWEKAAGGVRCRGNTWFLPYPTIQERARDRPHPATFPPELAEWCVRLAGARHVRRFADPFVGIGSSAVAAVRLGVDFTGFDIDRTYLAVARDLVRRERRRGSRTGASTTAGSGRSRREGETTLASDAS